jgi:hypothetical protein
MKQQQQQQLLPEVEPLAIVRDIQPIWSVENRVKSRGLVYQEIAALLQRSLCPYYYDASL